MSKSAKPPISVHILDTSRGRPATGVPITLYKEENGTWHTVGNGQTNADGRCETFLTREQFSSGTFKIHYAVEDYFMKNSGFSFYPYIEVVFKIDNAGNDQNYHIPLLLNPFGYSTYRGS
ncbi:probable 5-hydroxyisourate hydrolase R09H10.3 [Phlebotomus argentipes]|uniref:probable 5-hydroxyisourate hydrolase R09H10.3 n=1 Tax=Phlebotomus argentipes TaxID=94469 RepID=UPI002892BD6D|nr:probable 5-hydroxyisourate hydrolase R09H10.3 [Phlebotomus argentipes]